MWKNSSELLSTIHDAHDRLKSGMTDAITAHAEARILGAATRILAITLEHARLTGRLEQGSDSLPLMTITQGEEPKPAIDVAQVTPRIAPAAEHVS